MIKEILMENIKGQNDTQRLTGKDIFTGLNGIGKTTRLQALGISLLGHVAGKGKLEAETFKLSSNQNGTMTVGVETDDFNFTRSFTKKESNNKDGSSKVSITQDITLSPSQGEKGIKQKEARVLAEMGSFPVMLDFGEFLSLSDGKRREFIYSLSPVKSSSWDREKVENSLRSSILAMDLEVNNPDQYAICEELINEALAQWTDRLDLQAGLQAMHEWAKTKKSHWDGQKKDAQGAVRKISELKNQLEETDRNIANNKKELESMQQQLIEVEKQISTDTEKKRNVEQRLDKIAKYEQQIKTLKENVPVDNSAEIDKQINDLKGQVEKVDVTDAVRQIENELTVNENRQKELVTAREDLYKQIADKKAEIQAFEKVIKTIGSQNGLCLLTDMLPGKKIGCEKDFSKVKSYVQEQVDANSTKLKSLDESYSAMGKELKETLIRRANELRGNIKIIQSGANDQLKKNDAIQKQITQLEKAKTDALNAESRRVDQLNLYQEELLKLQKEPVDAIAPIDMLETRANGLREQIKGFKTKIDEQEKAKTTLGNLKSSMIDSKKSSYYADGSKYLVEALGAKGIQGELVKEVLDPIRVDIQNTLSLMGIDREFFFITESENGKEIFQFGWKNEFGDELNFDALSTGQQMLLLIALMTTIIGRANPKIKILAIDNIENLDSKNFTKVIDGLNKLDGKLDNIILAGVIQTGELPGWTVWDLNPQKELKTDAVA